MARIELVERETTEPRTGLLSAPTHARTTRLLLAYDGTGFRGWAAQRDPAIRTVKGRSPRCSSW